MAISCRVPSASSLSLLGIGVHLQLFSPDKIMQQLSSIPTLPALVIDIFFKKSSRRRIASSRRRNCRKKLRRGPQAGPRSRGQLSFLSNPGCTPSHLRQALRIAIFGFATCNRYSSSTWTSRRRTCLRSHCSGTLSPRPLQIRIP